MQTLYYDDQYTQTFTAEILHIVEKNDEFHVQLNQTYFYPGHEEHPCDIGHIENIPVISVYEDKGVIYHVVKQKPIKLRNIKCYINWEHRFHYMQHHLGQHLLSACLLKVANTNTIALQLTEDGCIITVDKPISQQDVDAAEKMVNDIICDGLPVAFLSPTKSELKKLGIKKAPPKTTAPLRVVHMEDLDTSICYGLHPRSTIEVQMMKMTSSKSDKTSTKIQFLCGRKAIQQSFATHQFAATICAKLKCNETEAFTQIENLTGNFNKLVAENRTLKSDIADYEVQKMIDNATKINNIHIIKSIYKNADIKHINLLATRLTTFDNVIVLFAVESENGANLIFMCSKNVKKFSMNNLLKDAITLIDGKGGGSDFSAQGAGKNKSNLISAMDYALMKTEQAVN